MLFRRFAFLFIINLGLVIVATPAGAQEEDDLSTPPRPTTQDIKRQEARAADAQTATMMTVEKIMEQAVRNISHRYNLNEVQAKVTEDLMKQRVHSFLKQHEAEVWPLIREMLATQFGMNPPQNENEVKRIGSAAKPLAKVAEKAILEGNEEWRKILTPEQRVMHDHDLADMNKTFREINKNLDRWADGNPPRDGIFPMPPAVDRSPPRPPRPSRGIPQPPEPEVVTFRESFFDAFVNQFIKENELDPGQITSAHSILTEFKEKAGHFKVSNKEAFTKITVAQREASASRDREKMAAVDEARQQLLQPVYQLFEEMEERLAALLTSTQLAKFNERKGAPERVAANRRKQIDQELVPDDAAAVTQAAQKAQPPTRTPASEPAGKPAPKPETE